jgi:hypothetical protein
MDTNVDRCIDTNVDLFIDTNVDRCIDTNVDLFIDTNALKAVLLPS